jgi:hypothetical protein
MEGGSCSILCQLDSAVWNASVDRRNMPPEVQLQGSSTNTSARREFPYPPCQVQRTLAGIGERRPGPRVDVRRLSARLKKADLDDVAIRQSVGCAQIHASNDFDNPRIGSIACRRGWRPQHRSFGVQVREHARDEEDVALAPVLLAPEPDGAFLDRWCKPVERCIEPPR